jgi:hypothetical protein
MASLACCRVSGHHPKRMKYGNLRRPTNGVNWARIERYFDPGLPYGDAEEKPSRAVRRSPAAPRRQAKVSGATRNRSRQASPAATVRPARADRWESIWVASSQAVRPTARTAPIRQGRLWV